MDNKSKGKMHYAFIAGFCASTASFFGKLASSNQEIFVNTIAQEVSKRDSIILSMCNNAVNILIWFVSTFSTVLTCT